MEDQVFELLEQKDFNDLTKDERVIVLSHMSQEAYDQQRALIAGSTRLFESPDPAPNTLLMLREAAIARSSKQTIPMWQRILSYPLPAYQGALGAFALALVVWFAAQQAIEAPLLQQQIVYETKYDTIWSERVDTVELPVEKVVYVNRPIPAAQDQNEAPAKASAGITPTVQELALDQVKKSFGNTSVREEELRQFLVTL